MIIESNTPHSDTNPLLSTVIGCFRYVVNISFKQDVSFMAKRIENIAEPVKTLKEAQEYKSLIDNTVAKACIVDRITNKVVEWWVY